MNYSIKRGRRYWLFLVIMTVVLILLSILAESLYFSDFEYRRRTTLFNKTLAEKEQILENCINSMKSIMARGVDHESTLDKDLFSTVEENNITILYYIDNKLADWSDNDFDVPLALDDSQFNVPLIFLQNGWFLTKTIEAGNEKIVGLLRIFTQYSFENNLIKSGFEEVYNIPVNAGFSFDENDSDYHIYNKDGNYLFSLIFTEETEKTYIFIPLFIWACAFIMFIILSLELARMIGNSGRQRLSAAFILVIYFLFYIVILFSGKPTVLFKTELFSSYVFFMHNFIPSLGHLILLSVLAICFSYVFFLHHPIPDVNRDNVINNYISLTLLLAIAGFLIGICNHIFTHLFLNTNINFETYKILEINMFSIAGFTSAIFLLMVPVFFLFKVLQNFRLIKPGIIILSIITSAFVLIAVNYNDTEAIVPLIIFYFILTFAIWILINRRTELFNITVILSLIFGVFFLYSITVLSEEKIRENIKIQAVTFSTENDPEAEHLLLDLWPVISTDTLLAGMMKLDSFDKIDFEIISDYLLDTYFTGYWRNFNYSIVLCRNDESIHIGTVNAVAENCFGFFENRIRRDGHRLTGTGFYFLDNQGGRSYYVGRLFFNTGEKIVNGLFIELYSDVNVFQPGYSELLLDKKYHGYSGLKDYSFAKYINGEMVLMTGEFPYDKTDKDYVNESTDFKFFELDGFKHILYRNGNATVLIGRPKLTAGDLIISFAYYFVFIFLLFNIIILLVSPPRLKYTFNLNFRQKLQLSVVGVLLFAFTLIGGVIAAFTIHQYQDKHNENLKEKLNSIYLELESELSMEKHLSAGWRNSNYPSLNDLLIRLSNVFKTDINLYDLNGILIATSRPEIFFRDLASRRINNKALINLHDLTRSEYFQKEQIGSLEYVSAYVPFFNMSGQVLAYLNLPYFRMQNVLAKEISNLVVAVINFTLLLIIITMSLAVFISGRLTSPLMMLGEGLASVGVGKKSEHLSYKGNDEIGELVKQYNRMVDEIEESTNKLAVSEREFAWREMAKQIAHEIKNPLTPMKLNVQQLYKSWKDKAPGFDDKLEHFTKNQIEYIDNLSNIASAFSSFAKMPVKNPVEVDLLDQIKITLELFRDTENIKFSVKWPHESKVIVYADKEHLNGIFSNLFKNSIQSIPSDREGLIDIEMKVRHDKVIVSISDNGAGIPEYLKKKMFTPNFTTKSSGMGLGLSIVKKYIENANGRIWFESEADKGSVFYIELPLLYTVEKPL
jgi:two-component system, NtrC family, nitrogen regulation sensor histidine kinase NtrY